MQKNSSLPSTIKITKKLIRSVKAARKRCELDLAQQKKSAKQDKHNQQLTVLKSEIKDVMQKKQLSLWKLVKIKIKNLLTLLKKHRKKMACDW